jgi:hypothetical protein
MRRVLGPCDDRRTERDYIEMKIDKVPVPNNVLLLVRAEATSAPEQKVDEGRFLLTNNIPPHMARICSCTTGTSPHSLLVRYRSSHDSTSCPDDHDMQDILNVHTIEEVYKAVVSRVEFLILLASCMYVPSDHLVSQRTTGRR